MLDGAEMLFGPCRDLGEVGEDAVCICAILAIQLLGQVEIGEAVAVERYVGTPVNLRDAVDRKADCLVDGTDDVGEEDGYRAHPDDWRSDDDEKPRVQQIAMKSDAQLPVFDPDGVGEMNRPALNLVAEFRLFLHGFLNQIPFKLPHLAEQCVESVIHSLEVGCAGHPDKTAGPTGAGAFTDAAFGTPAAGTSRRA